MSDSATPGWYHAEGDPPGTERYWDGTTWTEGPRPVGGTPDVASTDMPDTSGFGTTTPGSGFESTTPDTSATESFGIDMPGEGAPDTPDVGSPGGFSTETPSAAAGGFGAPPAAASTPQDGFGAPRAAPGGTPVQGGFPGAPAGAVGFYPEESNATTALIISIVGFLLCGPVAIVGGVMGNTERKAIAEGRRDPAGQGKATAALVIGAIAAVLTILVTLLVILIVLFSA